MSESLIGLVRITEGSRKGMFGRIVEKIKEKPNLYQVEFPRDSSIIFFFESDLSKVTKMPCPDCLKEGIIPLNHLFEPQHSSEGWIQKCPQHGELFLWGWHHFFLKPLIKQTSTGGFRKITRCDICGKEMEDNTFAMTEHKLETGHRLYSRINRSMP